MIKDCPKIRNKKERIGFKAKKGGKQAMITTSDKHSESETEKEEIANLYLIASESIGK